MIDEKNNLNNINVEEKYQIKDEIQHILDRSSAWIGSKSIEYIDYLLYQPSENKLKEFKDVEYNAGLLKMIDEVISNSVDESRRNDALYKLTNIDIKIETNGHCIIRDNGGIIIKKHKQLNVLIPVMIFGMLRTSSNYDDSQERSGIGVNGLGSKLTNIYSKKFIVRTADGHNKIEITWTNNMRDIEIGEIQKSIDHFTEIEFWIELERFGIEELNMAFCRILHKRAIDAAATNPHLIVNFECNIADGKLNSVWNFPTFQEYVNLFLPDVYTQRDGIIFYQKRKSEEIIITPAVERDFGFVNGAICSKGTHFRKVHSQISAAILKVCQEEEMDLITDKDIYQHISIFINCTIPNPEYTAQTKEQLSSVIKSDILNLSKTIIEEIKTSKIMDVIRSFYNTKYAKEKAKELSKLNKAIKSTATKKLIKGSLHGNGQELWIFEGDSASGGFRLGRNPMYQSAYLLRGKVKNTFNLRREQILENQELREICAACKLVFEGGSANIKNLPFDKLIFATDMDWDGSHICGLLLAFFAKHFPELLRAGKIFRALSPLVIVQHLNNHKDRQYYYSMEDYLRTEKLGKIPNNKYKIHYCKGLGALKDQDYKIMLQDQKLIQFNYSEQDMRTLDIWFNKATEQRKEIICQENELIY
jgi:DNA topoisomerase-2